MRGYWQVCIYVFFQLALIACSGSDLPPDTSPDTSIAKEASPRDTRWDISPKPLTPMKLEYPKRALERRFEGNVILAIEITPEGIVSNSTIKQSSNYKELDDAALTAIRTVTFSPAIKDGKAVAVKEVYYPIIFRLPPPSKRQDIKTGTEK